MLTEPPQITAEVEEGFVDLLLYIREHKIQPDGTQLMRAVGLHKGSEVGLVVMLGSRWSAGSLGKDWAVTTHQGTATYESIGPQSDALVRVLNDLYQTKLAAADMKPRVEFTAISLGGDPRDLSKEKVHIKLFFEADNDEEYAEVFTNIDLPHRRLEIREKDNAYRTPLMKALFSLRALTTAPSPTSAPSGEVR